MRKPSRERYEFRSVLNVNTDAMLMAASHIPNRPKIAPQIKVENFTSYKNSKLNHQTAP